MNDRTRSTYERGGRDEPARRSRASYDGGGRGDDRGGRGDDRGRERVRDDRGGRGDDRGGGRERVRDDAPRTRERDTSRAARGYTYRERDASSVQKRSQMGNTDFDKILVDGVKSWTPADGGNIVRILPPTWDNAEHFGVDIFVHYGIGPDRQSYLCLNRMKGERCPICDERALALKDGDTAYAKDLEPRRRVLVYVIDRDAEKEGLQAWAMPQSVDQDLAKVSIDKRSGAVLPIDHPYKGYDIEFDREGKQKNTKYKGLMIARDSTELGDDRWLEEAEQAPLPTILAYHDYDYIKSIFDAGGGQPAGGDDGRRDSGRDARDAARGDDGRGDGRGHDRGGDVRGGDRVREGSDRNESRGAATGGQGGGHGAAADPTWQEVHEMSSDELDRFVEDERLNLDPSTFKTDEDLADAICSEMGIPKPRAAAQGEGRERLADMRRGR